MTREVIIKSIYLNKGLADFAKKTTKHNDLWQDILSETILYISEMPEPKLVELYRSQGIINYCYKIIHLSWNSPNSPVYKKYRTHEGDELTKDLCQIECYDPEIDVMFGKCEAVINEIEEEISLKRYPSEVKIFQLYTEIGSVRETAKQLRIPTMTVWGIIDQFKTKIKSKL